MKVAIIGGGPAGLYLALLLKKANPAHDVTVFERNRADSTFGWGVVFSDQTLENFRAADAATHQQITDNFAHWDNIDIFFKGSRITSGGHGFSGIAREKLLSILQARAKELGADLRFEHEVRDFDQLQKQGADLIVAADGVNSCVRRKYSEFFHPDLDVRPARYIWLGTNFKFDAFTFYFVENQQGVFQAHCYRFDADTSTFIVECDEASWRAAGFDKMDLAGSVAACERLFEPWLHGSRLMSNASHQSKSPWQNFVRVRNKNWFHENVVLIGDAAHTAHFSVGSGTKLAMEDAISLSAALASENSLQTALQKYHDERQTEALRLQNAARNSMEWFENVKRYVHLEPEQFAYSLLTRSQRVSHENLRVRDAKYLSGVERWFAARASKCTGSSKSHDPAPMFTPFQLREMGLQNRVVVSPMDMYSAQDGTPNDFHLVHLGSRALGGAGLIMSEMTCVSPEARITLGCTGMYSREHVAAWRRIVDFVHTHSEAKICLQLGHSGRKGSIKLPWEAPEDVRLDSGNWELLAPSAIAYSEKLQRPREMRRADMDSVRDNFVRATKMATEAGFDMIELHCAHGYLLSSFITPLSNHRNDEYGGCLQNRLRFPIEVFSAMRASWPEDKPMSVRISATDWVEDGITGADAVAIARAFHQAGADIVHVSTGQTSAEARPVYGRMYQTPFSDRIRQEAGVPTIAVGNITEADQVNSIIAGGRADLCALARPHLADPYWTLHAAADLDYEQQTWPVQYLTGKQQLYRNTQRKKQSAAALAAGKKAAE